MKNYREEVLQLLQTDKIRHLYANTYYSLHDRLDEEGYLPESFVPGRYVGDFGRTSGAYTLLMAEFGNLDLAERALRFVLDGMRSNRMMYCPHILEKTVRQPNGELVRGCHSPNQLDATGHLLLAYATLVLDHGVKDLVTDYWDFLSDIMNINLTLPNFCGDEMARFASINIRLFYNASLEHSREHRYWSCFDILTQSFMGAALERFIELATRLGEDKKAAQWQKIMDMLKQGLRDHLTETRDGKLCYAEMRLPDSNTGRLYDGIGWLNLSPLAAGWDPVSREVTRNTVHAVRDRLWLEDPAGDGLHYLDLETQPDGNPSRQMIGKGTGWDMEAALREEEFEHLYDVLNFLYRRHDADVFCEFMAWRDGKWISWDNGNGEQCVWWCRAMGRVRKALGLSAMPDRADVTHSPADEK